MSVGMPVRDGERHLTRAIECLLGQDFEDFELIISDNASCDATEDICRSHARSDTRVRYSRLRANAGSSANFNRVLAMARGEYFMWAADDDERHPTYVSTCLRTLEDDPGAVSCATGVEFVDESDKVIGRQLEGEALTHADWARRISAIIARRDAHLGFGFYGLHRRRALESVGPLGEGFGADVLLTLRLAKLGRWRFVPQPLLRYRFPSTADEERGPDLGRKDDRPVSSLLRSVWQELGASGTARERIAAQWAFLLAVGRPGGAWNRMLTGENGRLLRSAIAERHFGQAARHGIGRLVLDPLGVVRPRHWGLVSDLWQRRDRAEEA